MVKVHLSRAAYADLVEIVDYGTAKFGEAAADAYQNAIDQAFARLQTYPLSGEARPQYGHGMRCFVCRRHRIVYLIEDDTVQIARILHHSRDVPKHLPDDR